MIIDAHGHRTEVHLHEAPDPVRGLPLLVAVHGGTYTSAYFAVPGGPGGSFLDVAARNGFDVLLVERPGYGASDPLDDEDNTAARHAEVLDGALAAWLADRPARPVVLVGHSIGGMTVLELAARHPSWPLVGVCATGMGAHIPAGGAAEQLGALPLSGVVDLRVPDREAVMLGPAGSWSEQARRAALASYAPTPFVELQRAPRWARERLAAVAAAVQVPVQNFVGEHDALWDSGAQARADFVAAFTAPVTSDVVPGAGHCLDHHLAATAVHLHQLAFAVGCVSSPV